MDSETNIENLKNIVKKFCEERDWDRFHNPKDLSIGIVTEASELLSIFRFLNNDESINILNIKNKREMIEEELSDVLFFILRFSQKYDIDLSEAFIKKMKKNEEKYPAEKFRGINKKYNEV
ncbi:MAG: nucleotide pyrophosphohydrolase [Thermoplasmata archaeon]